MTKIIISRDVTFNENEFPYYHDTDPSTCEEKIPSATTNKFQAKEREKQAETSPTSMDNQAEVDDNVRVDHMAGREEDVEHLNHVHGEKEENVTTSNNPNLRNYQLARDQKRR